MTKNVIEFPKSKIVRDPTPFNEEEKTKNKEKNKKKYVEDLLEDFTSAIYEELEDTGIDTETLSFQKDFVFLTDVLRSLVYRTLGLEHPIHDFIDKSVRIRTLPAGASKEDIENVMKEMLEEFGNVENVGELEIEEGDLPEKE